MISISMCLMPPKLEISGHAGYAQPGKDIVCAAVSALYETLRAHPMVRTLDDGDRHLIVADGRAGGLMIPVFEAFSLGFEQLARQYPQNVEFKHIIIE